MKLVLTKGHVFARWDASEHANASWRARFNIEATDRGLSTPLDVDYKTWPSVLTEAEIANDWFLRSLTPVEELAVFLMQRGHCLEDTGRGNEAQMAYAEAHRLAPKSPEAAGYLAALVRKERETEHAVDPEVLAAQERSDIQRAWLKQKRREAEEIAQRPIERPSDNLAPVIGSDPLPSRTVLPE